MNKEKELEKEVEKLKKQARRQKWINLFLIFNNSQKQANLPPKKADVVIGCSTLKMPNNRKMTLTYIASLPLT